MAEMIYVDGQPYLKREPLGVVGLSIITFGIYFFYWYYEVNDELRRFAHDDTISPLRSLLAMTLGWIILVPPFIAMYNTAKQLQAAEQRRSIQPVLEPAFTIVIMLLVAVGNGIYVQEHLNRLWDRAAPAAVPAPPVGA